MPAEVVDVSQLSDVKVTDVHSNLDLSEPAPDLFHFLVVVCPWTGGESAESCSFSAESYQSWGGSHVAGREALTQTKRLIPKPWISGSLSLEISFSSWKGHKKAHISHWRMSHSWHNEQIKTVWANWIVSEEQRRTLQSNGLTISSSQCSLPVSKMKL